MSAPSQSSSSITPSPSRPRPRPVASSSKSKSDLKSASAGAGAGAQGTPSSSSPAGSTPSKPARFSILDVVLPDADESGGGGMTCATASSRPHPQSQPQRASSSSSSLVSPPPSLLPSSQPSPGPSIMSQPEMSQKIRSLFAPKTTDDGRANTDRIGVRVKSESAIGSDKRQSQTPASPSATPKAQSASTTAKATSMLFQDDLDDDDDDEQLALPSRKKRRRNDNATTDTSTSLTRAASPALSDTSTLTALDFSDDDEKERGNDAPAREVITISSGSDDGGEDDETTNEILAAAASAPRARRAVAKQNTYAFAPKMYRSTRPNKPPPISAAAKANIVPESKSKYTLEALLREKKRKARLQTDLKGIETLEAMAAADLAMYNEQQQPKKSTRDEDIAKSIRELQEAYWDDLLQDGADGDADANAPARHRWPAGNPLHHIWEEPVSRSMTATRDNSPMQTNALEALKRLDAGGIGAGDDTGALSETDASAAAEAAHQRQVVADILQREAEAAGRDTPVNGQQAESSSAARGFALWRRGRVQYDALAEIRCVEPLGGKNKDLCLLRDMIASQKWAAVAAYLDRLSLTPASIPPGVITYALLLSIHAQDDAVVLAARHVVRAVTAAAVLERQPLTAICGGALIALGARRDLVQSVLPDSERSALQEEPPIYGPSEGKDRVQDYLSPRARGDVIQRLLRLFECLLRYDACDDKAATAATSPPSQLLDLVHLLHLVACDDASYDPVEMSQLQQGLQRGALAAMSIDVEHRMLRWIVQLPTAQEQYRALQRFPNATPALRTLRRNIALECLFGDAAVPSSSSSLSQPILPDISILLDALRSTDEAVNPLYAPRRGTDFVRLEARIALLGVALGDFALNLAEPGGVTENNAGDGEEPPAAAPSRATWGHNVTTSFRNTLRAYLPASVAAKTQPSRRRLKQLEGILAALGAAQVRISAASTAAGATAHSLHRHNRADNASLQKSHCSSALSRIVYGSQYVLDQACGIRMHGGVKVIMDDGDGDGEADGDDERERDEVAKRKEQLRQEMAYGCGDGGGGESGQSAQESNGQDRIGGDDVVVNAQSAPVVASAPVATARPTPRPAATAKAQPPPPSAATPSPTKPTSSPRKTASTAAGGAPRRSDQMSLERFFAKAR